MDIILTKRYDKWLWPNGCYPTVKLWLSSWQRDMIIGCGLMAVIQLKLWISSWQWDLIGCGLWRFFPAKNYGYHLDKEIWLVVVWWLFSRQKLVFPRRLLLSYKTPLTPLSTSRLFRYRAPATCSHQGYYAVSLKMVTLGWKLKSNSIFFFKIIRVL